MSLVAGKRLATEVITLAETGKRIGRRRGGDLLTQNGFQTFNDKILDGGAAARSGDFRPFQNAFRQIDCRFHKAINTGIWVMGKACLGQGLGPAAPTEIGKHLAFCARIAAINGRTEQSLTLLTSAMEHGIENYPWLSGAALHWPRLWLLRRWQSGICGHCLKSLKLQPSLPNWRASQMA